MEPLSSDELLVFWVQLSVILLTARGLGTLMRRIGQPSVIGELAAGLLIGPTLLGRLAPEVHGWLFPQEPVHSGLLLAFAWVGAALLLTVTGFETDLGLLRKLGRQTFWVSTGSLVVPLLLGFAIGWAMPALFIGAAGDRVSFALFAGIALAISALPVVARILMEMSLMRRNFGQVTVAAAMANDLVGYLLVGAVSGLVAAGGFDLLDLGVTLALFALFVAVTFLYGQRGVDRLLRAARRGEHGQERSFTVLLGGTFVAAAIAQAIGVEAVLGALLAGIVFGRSRYLRPEARASIETLTSSFVAPLFFATAGLFVDLGLLLDPEIALWAVVVLVVAAASKLVGSYLGARMSRLGRLEGLALGIGLNARGALQVVIATIGLGIGVLNTESYTVIMVTAIVTSMMTPPLLRAVLQRFETSPEERARLEREEILSRSIIARTSSALLPTRGGGNSVLAAQLLHQSLRPEASVTLLTIHGPDADAMDRRSAEEAVAEAREVFAGRNVDRVDKQSREIPAAIRTEASLGHGLLALGLTEAFAGSEAVSPVLARTIAQAPVPVLLVKHGVGVDGHSQPLDLRRILVPIGGDRVSRAAQEIAYTLGERSGAGVDALHVVNRPDRIGESTYWQPGSYWHPGAGGESDASSLAIAARVLRQADELAEQFGCTVTPLTRTGPSLGAEVAAAANERGSDLIVVGAVGRSTDEGLFLGHGVDYLLESAQQTVLVVVFPSDGM
ncbi:hypothetical protein ER308_00610 [Egibacter rhizosphaerae]|uniref:Cation:proton antiporter n=1 Tax=Egibacter rhizosphaerae TaxID=1670831 RepID=A0A411YAH6_9ACTN|nr:cation:proton antiporter [Egibacter rhizosphaerae]QBI18220.1 hypothetical protein ER308_00610 [Egibacter rhizosphaerae]